MPNDWTTKENNWLDKQAADPLPLPPPKQDALKTLDTIIDNRQLDSEKPKPPVAATPLPELLETIPYSKVASDLENAAQAVLAAFSKLGQASVYLGKISIEVPSDGPKGKSMVDKGNGFRQKLDLISTDIKKMSEEIASFKNSLPKDTIPQV